MTLPVLLWPEVQRVLMNRDWVISSGWMETPPWLSKPIILWHSLNCRICIIKWPAPSVMPLSIIRYIVWRICSWMRIWVMMCWKANIPRMCPIWPVWCIHLTWKTVQGLCMILNRTSVTTCWTYMPTMLMYSMKNIISAQWRDTVGSISGRNSMQPLFLRKAKNCFRPIIMSLNITCSLFTDVWITRMTTAIWLPPLYVRMRLRVLPKITVGDYSLP